MSDEYLHAGMGRVTLPVAEFDLGYGIFLRQTYAHLFSPCMMAFSPAEQGQPHPAPWRAAGGGFSFDVTVELSVPINADLPAGLSAHGAVEWIVALMRLSFCPYLIVPVLSDISFSEAAQSEREPRLTPLEVQNRPFMPPQKVAASMPESELNWIKENWSKSADLLNRFPKFRTALQAVDNCTAEKRTSSSLLAVWGAIEQLFSTPDAELKFRVASYIAAYIEPPGEQRLELFKRTKKLYNIRSTAAHSTAAPEFEPFVDSFVIARNALIKMIKEDHVPSQNELEEMLFGVRETPKNFDVP